MENYEECIDLIDKALEDTKIVVAKSKWMRFDSEPILSTQRVLQALRSDFVKNPDGVNERILRAMHDLGMSAFKEFENTPLEESIAGITSFLYKSHPIYKSLKPLGSDFGKGVPA